MPDSPLFNALATSLLAGDRTVDATVERCAVTLGRRWRWLRPLVRRFVEATAAVVCPRHREVVRFLRDDDGFRRARAKYRDELSVAQRLVAPPQMAPVGAAAAWELPAIGSAGELADWLRLTPGELDWFADLKALTCHKAGRRLQHYHYRVLSKGYGTIRVIESPKPRLKQLQKRILADILDKIPPHPMAHGFVKGRSVKTFVAPHVGRRVVLRMDLRDFFPSIGGARIQTVFRTMGYPESVADLLGGIATNTVPRDVWTDTAVGRETRAMYACPHLPQGAPTSPALANMCLYRADCRLLGLAGSAGARYTRYADDLAFSGGEEFDRRVERFASHVAAILHEEGFAVHHRKTRIMRQGVCQHLAGVVANQRINVRRSDFDRLKATLFNCVRHGSASQNRDGRPDFRAHLETGRRSSPFQVRAEVRVGLAILTCRAVADAVRKGRLQLIEVPPLNVQAPICHHTRQMLSHTLAHDARLAMMDRQTFFMQDRGGMRGESLDAAVEIVAAGERQIVGVARVLCAGAFRETAQPAIGTIQAHVGERRRGGRALRQVRARVEGPRLAAIRDPAPDTARRGVGRDAAEQVGHRFGVSQGAKDGLNARAPDGGEEVAQVHAQYHALAHVRSGERPHRPSFDEPVRRRMGWNPVQNLRQDSLLDPLQAWLGRFDQANRAVPLVQHAIVIVPQSPARFLVGSAFRSANHSNSRRQRSQSANSPVVSMAGRSHAAAAPAGII